MSDPEPIKPAPLQRLDARGPSTRAALLVVALAFGLVAGAALAGDGGVADGIGREPGAWDSPPPTGTGSPQTGSLPVMPTVIHVPRAGDHVDALLPIEVRGTTGGTVRQLRASVSVGGRELGLVHLEADAQGRFRGRIPVQPVTRATPASVWLHDSISGYAVSEIPFVLEPAGPVSLWSPRRRWARVPDGTLQVSGAALSRVQEIDLELRAESGLWLARSRVDTDARAGGWRSFSTELSVPETAVGPFALRIAWPDPATGRLRSVATIPLRSRGMGSVLADPYARAAE